jgi:hypothetical protein
VVVATESWFREEWGDGGELFDIEAGSDSSRTRLSMGRRPRWEKRRCVVAFGWLRAVAGPARGDLQLLATQRRTRGFLRDARIELIVAAAAAGLEAGSNGAA